jgi:WD40 repeat protein
MKWDQLSGSDWLRAVSIWLGNPGSIYLRAIAMIKIQVRGILPYIAPVISIACVVARVPGLDAPSRSQAASLDNPILEYEIAQPGSIAAVAFSPDGSILAIATSRQALKLWDTRTRKEIRTLHGAVPDKIEFPDGQRIVSLSFSPDGRALACAGDIIGYGRLLGSEVRVWEVGTGKLLRSIVVNTRKADVDDALRRLLGQHPQRSAPSAYLKSVAFLPRGDRVLTVSRVIGDALREDGGDIAEWDARTGNMKRRWPLDKPVFSAALAPDGFTLAIGRAKQIELWNLNTAHLVRALQEAHVQGLSGALSFTPDGRMIAGACGNELVRPPGNPAGWPEYCEAVQSVHIWNTDGAYLKRLNSIQPGIVTAVSSFPDGSRIAVGCTTGVVRLYRTKQRAPD